MKISQKLCNKLNVNGPFNLRLLFSKGMFYVIEMNLRASRSFPFISKTLGINFINLAAKIMLSSKELLPIECDPVKLGIEHVAIKYPKFSFKRLGCDPVLGLEMSSTGEVGCLGYDQYDALLKALLASDFMIPEEGSNILLISENAQEIEKFSDHVNVLHRFNYNIYYYSDKNSNEVHNLVTEITYEKAVKMLNDHQIKLIISFANISPAIFEETPQSKLRKLGLVFNCSFIYSCEVAMRFCDALDQQYQKKLLFDSSLQDYHNVEVLISPEKISSKIIPNKLLTPAENFIKRKKYLIEALSEKQKN
jgi:carbamoyl-phosphate synthase large subunit